MTLLGESLLLEDKYVHIYINIYIFTHIHVCVCAYAKWLLLGEFALRKELIVTEHMNGLLSTKVENFVKLNERVIQSKSHVQQMMLG